MITIHHMCITTNKYQESLKFYTEILGFKKIKETKGFHLRSYSCWLALKNIKIELQTPKSNEKCVPFRKDSLGIVHCAFIVKNIENFHEKLKKRGFVNFIIKDGKEIYTVCGEKLMKIVAPEGTIIELRETDI